jgi:hypothetical protein
VRRGILSHPRSTLLDMSRIEVRSRVPGGAEPPPTVQVDLAGDRVTVRQLIILAVEEHVRELVARVAVWETAAPERHAALARCRAMLDRQYLTSEEIREQAAAGRVRFPSRPAVPGLPEITMPDPDAEVARAVRAFERGTVVVFAGGRQVASLDEEVTVRLGEPVVFLRLVPLVGG